MNARMFAMKGKKMSLEKKEYDSFGNIISDSNPDFEIPFGFAGGLYDKDSKLIRTLKDSRNKGFKEAIDTF